MFGMHFVKTGEIDKNLGKFFSDIFDLRQSSDYEDYTEFSREDVMDLMAPAGTLIANIEEILNVN